VKCNRLFIVGVVTEVENIGKDNTLWRGRVADPTGVFTVYAGQYQPESAIFLSELNIPAYVQWWARRENSSLRTEACTRYKTGRDEQC